MLGMIYLSGLANFGNQVQRSPCSCRGPCARSIFRLRLLVGLLVSWYVSFRFVLFRVVSCCFVSFRFVWFGFVWFGLRGWLVWWSVDWLAGRFFVCLIAYVVYVRNRLDESS